MARRGYADIRLRAKTLSIRDINLRFDMVPDGYMRPKEKITRETAEKDGYRIFWPEKECRRGHEYWRRITGSASKCLACEHLHNQRRSYGPSVGWYATEKARAKRGEIEEY